MIGLMTVRNDQVRRSRHGFSCVSEKPSITERAVFAGRKAAELAALFETLANDTRLRVLNVLAHGVETSPMELAQKVGMKPQAICNQLRRLSDRGIIERRREGKQVYYRIVDPCVIDLLERGLWLIQDTELRKETRRGGRTAQRQLVETLSLDGSRFRDPSIPIRGPLGELRRSPESQINNKENKP
jgi:DNA-binding transcriptional ArsR family regulator